MNAADPKPVLVWDAPVRVFHWLLVFSFVGAFVTADSEYWRLVHVTLGYTTLGLVAFRIVWGFVGTRHARFANFVRGPRAVTNYFTSILRGHPEQHVGHNPAGAVAIVLLLVLTCVTAASGWATYHDMGGDWLEDLHEGAANTMLALVFVHVLAVLASSLLHRENLVRAMFDGRKVAPPEQAIRYRWRWLAAVIVAAVPTFWWLQWRDAARDGAATAVQSSARHRDG